MLTWKSVNLPVANVPTVHLQKGVGQKAVSDYLNLMNYLCRKVHFIESQNVLI